MKEEAHKYPSVEKPDLEAAESWRFPYWDWALKKPVPGQPHKRNYNVPLVVLPKVRISLPTVLDYGDVENAFYQFTMPGGITMGDPNLQDKNSLKDLRINPSVIRDSDDGKLYTFPVCLHRLCAEKLLTSFKFDQCKATSRNPKETGINAD